MTSKIPECSICFEHYNDQSKCPRLLSCGHSFCSSCLERLLHGNTIDCPTCRNPGAVPTGVEGLLKNFALLDIVNDTPKENVGSNTGSLDCENCGEKHPANFCCLDCKENMCKTAAQFHTRNKASRDHQVVSLEELEANPHLTSTSLICQKHNDKFRFFDEKCGHAVCRECVALEHFGHLCSPLAEAASGYGKEVKDLIKKTNVETGSAVEYELEKARLEKEVGYLQGLLKKIGFQAEEHENEVQQLCSHPTVVSHQPPPHHPPHHRQPSRDHPPHHRRPWHHPPPHPPPPHHPLPHRPPWHHPPSHPPPWHNPPPHPPPWHHPPPHPPPPHHPPPHRPPWHHPPPHHRPPHRTPWHPPPH